MRTVNTLQVGHERLRLRSCLGICQNIRCLVVFRLRRLGKRHVVVQAVTPAAAKGDGVLALGQLDVAPAVIVPALCVGDFHVLRPCAVIRTCDANRCLTGFANVAQIHQASGHQAVHARFLSAMADERSKASALYRSETGDPDEALSGVARILIVVHLCRNSCIVGQSQVLALRGEQRFICRH